MKSIFKGFLISFIGTFLITALVSCVCMFIFVIPTLVGYKCIGLLLSSLGCLWYTITFMKYISDNCCKPKRGDTDAGSR